MRKTSDLLPIFRSEAQARLLSTLFVALETNGASLSEVARRSDVAVSQAYRELRRLETAGIIESERLANVRLVRPNPGSPFHPELSVLLLKAFGPADVLRGLLEHVPEIDEAYIFGSWARRYLGEPGEQPRDVDLLVIGRPDLEAVYRAAEAAEEQLGRAINPTIVSAVRWRNPDTGFLEAVRSQARVTVIG